MASMIVLVSDYCPISIVEHRWPASLVSLRTHGLSIPFGLIIIMSVIIIIVTIVTIILFFSRHVILGRFFKAPYFKPTSLFRECQHHLIVLH